MAFTQGGMTSFDDPKEVSRLRLGDDSNLTSMLVFFQDSTLPIILRTESTESNNTHYLSIGT